jgi:Synergist-CTERM protein sorting domain-containing protein
VDESGEVTDSIVSPGKSYTIRIPIANYSFKATGPIDIAVSYNRGINSDLTPTPKTEITRTTLNNLPGWDATGDYNKTTVFCYWTVPADILASDAPGDIRPYWLYVEIDPDNKLKEVHDAWSDDDPFGNNVGYTEIAVIAEDSLPSMSAINASGAPKMKAAAAASDFTFALTNMTAEDIKEAARTGDTIPVTGRVTYNGAEKLTRVHVMFEDGKPEDENGQRRLLAEKYFPVIQPGASRDFHFIMTPSKLNGKNIYMYMYGDGLSMTEDHIGELIIDDDANNSGSGSGCNAGAGILALFVLVAAAARKH